jgi:hypothetical protein
VVSSAGGSVHKAAEWPATGPPDLSLDKLVPNPSGEFLQAHRLSVNVIRPFHSSAQRRAMMSEMGIYRQLGDFAYCLRLRMRNMKARNPLSRFVNAIVVFCPPQ